MAVVYRPTAQYQLSEPKSGKHDCLAYATAVAMDRHTLGGVFVTGRDVRLATNEPIPGTIGGTGLQISQIVDAAYKLARIRLREYRNAAWATLAARLREGRGVVLCVVRGEMPQNACADPFDDEHGIYLNSFNRDESRILVYDSLCKRAAWVNTVSVRRGAEAYGRRIRISGTRFAVTRKTPNI